MQPEVAHRGDDQSAPEARALDQVEGEEHHQVVAVAHDASRVDRDQAVGVAVEGQPQVGARSRAPPATRLSTCVEPQSSLMLRPSGWSWITVTSRAGRREELVRDVARRAVGAVDHEVQGREVARARARAGARRTRARPCGSTGGESKCSRSGAGAALSAASTASSVAWSSLPPPTPEDLQPVVVVGVVRRGHDDAHAAALAGDDRDARGREVAEVDARRSAVAKSGEDRRGQGRASSRGCRSRRRPAR